MRKRLIFIVAIVFLLPFFWIVASEQSVASEAAESSQLTLSSNQITPLSFKLGNEVLMSKYHHLIAGKRVGLITNQSGVNSKGESTINVLANDPTVQLTALYGPEHGIDGQASAGAYVESYIHPELGIPVYSLYGQTRMPTAEMLANVDVLVYDIQDIGARTYTYISTLNYCQQAAKKYGKTLIVLDRPNPVGGEIVDGWVLEKAFETFVGVDELPTAHGMTVGELALYFNREIGADVRVVPMEGYTRQMIYQDTGLPWIATSPNIPDLDSVFGYMATGLGEGTGIYQADKFKWIGGKGIDAVKFANLLNNAGLPGVTFIPEVKGSAGGVRLKITDYHTFNPAKTGLYALAYARTLNHFNVPKSGKTMVMFDKIMGTDKIGIYLEQYYTPQQIEAQMLPRLNSFKAERAKYLIYDAQPNRVIAVYVQGQQVVFDVEPFIDGNNRVIVPLRAIGEALGAEIDWDEEARVAKFSKEGREVLFVIDSQEALVNREIKTMDTCPVIKDGRTMLPLRYVGEFLGAQVDWDDRTSTVKITEKTEVN
ncbi:MAG: exo-beta-N-acetylmuramidase NamZ domain-containing protein [Peptococcia bacterium]|jgi:uncharacterized protein YbbC (DUF1343 family)